MVDIGKRNGENIGYGVLSPVMNDGWEGVTGKNGRTRSNRKRVVRCLWGE